MQDWVVRGESYSRLVSLLVSLQPVAFLVTIDSQLHQREFIFIYIQSKGVIMKSDSITACCFLGNHCAPIPSCQFPSQESCV